MYAYAAASAHSHRARMGSRKPVATWRVAVRRAVLGLSAFAITVVATAQVVHGQQAGGYQTVTVKAGDTVWSIAAERYPGDDTRARVDEILKANALGSASIHPGEQLKVPAS